ncbi:hypothetical protein L9F63_024966 [Diploptera punctata]|uniref:Uncharacterized protein n=1 Tax=Diploptera punctata TaxID=6984 RepID=A0AAD7ZEY6_DIPPU|nr:hypothetical protein L9F63_024966 [Diploptera punctata]
MSGWLPLNVDGTDGVEELENAKSTPEVLFKLKLLGGFFIGYKDTMYKGRLKITFIRNNNDHMGIHVWGSGKPGKIEIKSMYIRMPIVKYDHMIEVMLKSGVTQITYWY